MPTATTFCVQTDVENVLSALGVEEFTDHENAGSTDTTVLDTCITQASQELEMWCMGRYTAAVLATSEVVTLWTANMAAYFVCRLRGNPVPDSIAAEFQRLTDPINGILPKIKAGKLQIPGLALRGDLRPTISNMHIDRRYTHNRARVDKAASTNAPSELPRQPVEDAYTYDV
jgi:phage gp36-like protein